MIEERAVMGGLGPGVVLGQSKHQLQMIFIYSKSYQWVQTTDSIFEDIKYCILLR